MVLLAYTDILVVLSLNPSVISSVSSFAPVDTALICSRIAKVVRGLESHYGFSFKSIIVYSCHTSTFYNALPYTRWLR